MQKSAKKYLESFLAEDIKSGDITSKLLPRKKIIASIISRENGIVAGVQYAKEIFQSRNCKVTIHRKDGQSVVPNQKIITISWRYISSTLMRENCTKSNVKNERNCYPG